MASAAGEGRRGWALLAGALALAAARPLGCGPGDEGGTPVDETLTALLADVGPAVVLPALQDARDGADALVGATEAWAADPSSDAARDAAREAYLAALDAWQVAEVLQIGPAGSSLTAVAGEDRRDEIYSWPTTNRCRVDQLTVAGGWDDAAFYEQNLVTAWGYDALDTLLWSPDGVNACPPQVDVNTDGSWAALGTDGVRERRAAYAAAVAARLRDEIDALQQAWAEDGGDFSGAVAAAGADGSPYETADLALNAVFDALYYLETRTQDRKLGRPLGLRDCAGTDCVGEVETPASGASHRWIAANLRGFRAGFTAGDGVGMEDLLRELGHADVADALLAELDAADAAAAALTVPIEQAALGDPTPAVALHAAVVRVTTLFESEVATILSLRIPSEAAGDND